MPKEHIGCGAQAGQNYVAASVRGSSSVFPAFFKGSMIEKNTMIIKKINAYLSH